MFNLVPWKKKNEGGLTVRDSMERELTRLRDDFNTLFAGLWGRMPSLRNDWFEGHWGWALDVDDRPSEYVVRAEAPGFEVGDFDVQISGNNLVIRAERKKEEKRDGGSSYQYERLYRSVPLPNAVEPDKVEARYHNGVLELHLPKSREAQGQRIAVKSS
jgi:HSP20 family protein